MQYNLIQNIEGRCHDFDKLKSKNVGGELLAIH